MRAAALLPLLPALPRVQGVTRNITAITNWGHCRHGEYDPSTKACHCYKGWATAGITDTVDFLEGVCEQFHCQSDQGCRDVLGIPDATCPVPNWNCYCGWNWAFKNRGHGYETIEGKGGGECMGVMYTFSVWATEWVEWVMLKTWPIIGILSLLMLPFGRKRAICDHQWPSLWNVLRECFGCPSRCYGACVLSTEYTLDTFKDDIAWTLYVLDLGVWVYVALLTTYVVVLFIWSVVLWTVVIMALLAAALGGLFMCLGDAASPECNNCDLNCCGDCCGGVGDVGPGGDVGDLYAMGQTPGTVADSSYDAVYMYYHTPFDFAHAPAVGTDSRRDCQCCCTPLAWLVYVFPVMPENMWGGLLGRYVFGTHTFTPPESLYRGGNCIIDTFGMGWTSRGRRADFHDNASWRAQVRDFLLGEPGGQQVLPVNNDFLRSSVEEARILMVDGEYQEVITVGRAHAVVVNREFNEEGDQCVPSSWEDYERNQCWICADSNASWDLWLSCRHLFCKDCSTQMLQRRMPCPLCRVSSSTVLRGKAFVTGSNTSISSGKTTTSSATTTSGTASSSACRTTSDTSDSATSQTPLV